MKKILITGATGFLGRNILNRLVSQDNFIYVVFKPYSSNILKISKKENLKIIECDIKDYNKLNNIINDNIDVIYHFAWDGTQGIKRANINIQLNNIQACINIFNFAKENNCKKIIFPASIMEYEINDLMYNDVFININSLYSISKLSADYMLRTLCLNNGISFIRCLISNVYGVGEVSERFINKTIRKMLNNEPLSFTSGEQMYDFIYIDDAVNLIINLEEKGVSNKTYYIGSGKPRKLKEFIIEMKDCIDINITLGFGEIKDNINQLKYNEFDMKQTFIDTGYIIKNDFKTGIKKTIKYLRNRYDKF